MRRRFDTNFCDLGLDLVDPGFGLGLVGPGLSLSLVGPGLGLGLDLVGPGLVNITDNNNVCY